MGANKDNFELIFDEEEFHEVISFLKRGFQWTDDFAKKISNLVLSSRTKAPIAAINRTHGQINIAILIIYQGTIDNGAKEVLSTSSWYASPEKRGMIPIKFSKKLVLALSSYVVTNYTPNEVAGKIFKSLGFRPMDIGMIRGGFITTPPFFKINAFKYLKFKNNDRILCIENSKTLSDRHGGLFYSLYPRKIMGIEFNILNIYQTDQQLNALSFAQVIKMMLRNRALMLIIYYIDNRPNGKKAKWLIYDSVGDIRFLSPAGSELNILKC